VQAVIAPDSALTGLENGSTVTVTVNLGGVDGVLVVPAEAVVSRLDGSYAVQLQTAGGATQWHTVEILTVSGSSVGIRGDGVEAGATVLLPV